MAGGYGAVLAAARLLGLRREQCVHALGMNYAQAAGNRQALIDETLTKRLQPAFAARSALWAARLALRGLTGPACALDGEYGYFRTYLNGDVPAPEELLASQPWLEVQRVSVKRYPSCGACHSAQAAAERLVAEENLSPDEIDRVALFGCGPGGLVGRPFVLGPNPQVSAQFSAAWAVAHTLLRGPVRLEDYTDESVRADKPVLELAARIEFVPPPDDLSPGPERPPDFPVYSGGRHGLIVQTKGGRRLVRTQAPAETFAPGGASFGDVTAKFRRCAEFSGICPADRTEALIGAVRDLEKSPDLSGLIDLMILPEPVE
jgi:2-methylcitrate dehydratase PrpD